MRFMGTPWLVTWNTPHFSQARRTRGVAFGSDRSMTGTESGNGWGSEEEDGAQVWELGKVTRDLKSRGMGWWEERWMFMVIILWVSC